MSVNSMTFEQASSLLTSIVSQATGQTALTPTDESEFVSLATTTLNVGYDPIATAISQVIGKTIFSARPYSAQLKGLRRDSMTWGGITRKINYLDKELEDSMEFDVTDGSSIDPWTINKQLAVQTNFYGGNQFTKSYTIFRDQLNTAFHSSGEFGSYMSGLLTNINSQIEQVREGESRIALLNLIGAKLSADTDNVLHLLTMYQEATGNTTITASNVYSEDEFPYFAKWLYGFMNTLIGFMGERSEKYHMNISTYNGSSVSPIMRHTPKNRMKCYMLSSLMNQINSSVLSGVFHENLLKFVDYEAINFWQSIDSPNDISVTPVVMDSTGAVETAEAVTSDSVIGVLFDEEACGITTLFEETAPSPYNPRGQYYTVWMNFLEKWHNDLTENCVVLCLD